MIAMGLVLLLAATPVRMVFPGGSVVIPAGCTAPGQLSAYPDSWLGSIECTGGPSIFVFGSAMAPAQCQGTPLFTKHGRKLVVCSTQRKRAESGSRVRELVVDVGGTAFSAEVRQASDAAMLLSIVATLE
jgi:hypothetical protein